MDPFQAIIEGAQQYGLQQAAQSPYAMLPAIAQNVAAIPFSDDPYVGALANIVGQGVGGYGIGQQKQIAQQGQQDAYAQLVNNMATGAPVSADLQPMAQQVHMATAADKLKVAREQGKLRNDLIKTLYTEDLRLQASPAYQKTLALGGTPADPYKPILTKLLGGQSALGGAVPAGQYPSGQMPTAAQGVQVELPTDIPDYEAVLTTLPGGEASPTPNPAPQPRAFTFEDALAQAKGNPDAAKEIFDRHIAEDDRAFSRANQLRDDFEKIPEIKVFPEVEMQVKEVIAAADSKTPQGDYSMAVSVAKLLDPESVAREGEVKAVQNAQALPDWLKGEFTKQVLGGSGFSDRARAELKNIARRQYKERRTAYLRTYDKYKTISERNRVDLKDVVGSPPAVLFGQGTPTQGGAKYSPEQLRAAGYVQVNGGWKRQ